MPRATRLLAAVPLAAAGALAATAASRPAVARPAPQPAVAVPLPAIPAPRLAAAAGTDGAKLFVAYNCHDCHGAGGSGSMAPALNDNRWRYGGTQGEVFRSIAEGRPAGMPAWGAVIPGPQMVALAAYVRTLGEGRDVTTENFTGAGVVRTGH